MHCVLLWWSVVPFVVKHHGGDSDRRAARRVGLFRLARLLRLTQLFRLFQFNELNTLLKASHHVRPDSTHILQYPHILNVSQFFRILLEWIFTLLPACRRGDL